MIHGKVAVLMGGRSAEREISLMSGVGVLKALRAKGVDAHAFDPAQRNLADLKGEGFERCFIALHGRGGEDGTMQGALEVMGIPYTGSGVLGSAIAMDKWRTKMIWIANGLPTPRFRILAAGDDWHAVARELGLPLIVKPANEGSTLGLTKVTAVSQLPAAYELAAREYRDLALAESFVDGPEYTASLLGATALPLIRIEAPQGNYDYQHKYFSDDTLPCPAGCPPGRRSAAGAGAAGLRAARLRRLGSRRPDARRGGQAVAARSQHFARHDQPQPGADGGARRRHVLRGPVPAHPGRRPCGITRACSTQRLARLPRSRCWCLPSPSRSWSCARRCSLREVQLRGELAHTGAAEVEQAVRGRIDGNFFAVDLAQPRAALEQLPWVRRVQVRRVWPDRLEVTLEEHVALARWGDTGLVNVQGERFAGKSDAALPLLAGPTGSETEVALPALCAAVRAWRAARGAHPVAAPRGRRRRAAG
jgi:D-alanine-D-alanine ligase